MSKINNINNAQSIHAQRIADLSKKEKPEIGTFEIKELKNTASEALGRSQVSAKVDNLENNIIYMMKNPEAVKQANAFFDNIYENLKSKNVEDAYEKATQYENAFAEEFLNK